MEGPSIDATGLSVVVAPGEAPPPEWVGCARVRVDAVTAAVADELGAAWRERRPLVVELVPGLGLDDPSAPPVERVTGLEPWELEVDLDLMGERLHHALWANAVDARGSDTPASRWAAEARALGAAPTARAGLVTLPDGREAWCDGGPLDAGLPERLGLAVVHRIALEHGSLAPLGPNRSEAELAPDQLAAVLHPGAGARVIAPAGSGKTRVLTERARTLLRAWGLPTGALAVVAFNRRAADELRSRTGDLPGLRIRTLNALGLRLLPQDIRTVDERRAREHLGQLVDLPRRAEADPAAPWLEALARVRLGLVHPHVVEAELQDVSGLADVARRYRATLADRGEVDFDEQVVGAIQRLLADPPFRWRAQRFARLLLVDEFQDLTPAHLLLLRLLAGPAGAVFGVGDDDQTIYGYAGATPRWLVDFEQRFPGSGDHPLEVNYRCPPAVVGAAANLLTRNALRVPKAIRPAPGATDGPGALSLLRGEGDPAARTAEHVAALVAEEGAAPSDIAVLARVNAVLAPVQVLLRHHGLPVRGGVDARFLQRGGVRAALAWLAVASAPAKALPGAALREAARRPKRGLSDRLLGWIAEQRSIDDLQRLAGRLAKDRDTEKVLELAGDVQRVCAAAANGTRAVLDAVRHEVGGGGLDASAAALDGWSHGAVSSHGDDLDALSALADLEPDPGRFGPWLGDALSIGDDEGGVTLASIHAVKGQEWPHVVLHHVTAGLLPHRLVEDEEEERRVLHVGLTRGRVAVAVVPGAPPSRFLTELDAPGEPAPRPPRPAGAAATTAAGPRERGGTGVSGVAVERLAAPLPAVVGLAFEHGGYRHEVLDVDVRGVKTARGRDGDFGIVALGSFVRVEGAERWLVHPAYEKAFERLRAWRTQRADGKPAYTVLTDATLRSVAALLPTDEAALGRIRGIGPTKLTLYGDDLLTLAAELRG